MAVVVVVQIMDHNRLAAQVDRAVVMLVVVILVAVVELVILRQLLHRKVIMAVHIFRHLLMLEVVAVEHLRLVLMQVMEELVQLHRFQEVQ
jgi:hypothetical protein